MTPRQIKLVQQTWTQVKPIADVAAKMFYHKLFQLEPSVQHLFKRDLAEQGKRLMAMIGFAVQGLSRLDVIVPGLQSLGERHAGYGVRDRHYVMVGSALLWTLEQGLGKDFDDEVRDAWSAAYWLISSTMRDAAKLAA